MEAVHRINVIAYYLIHRHPVVPKFAGFPNDVRGNGEGNGNAGLFPLAWPPGTRPWTAVGVGLFHSVEKYCFAASASQGVNTALM